MEHISVRVDAAAALFMLKQGEKRIPYLIADTINATAKKVQEAEVRHGQSIFTLRNKAEFIRRQLAIIKPFASPSEARYFAIISVGQKQGLLLPRFEAGGVREPVKGKNVAIPVIGGARPTQTEQIPESFFFSSLRFRRSGGKRGGSVQGLLGTYIVPAIGVFQRVAGQPRGKLIYAFKHSVKLKPELRFVQTARSVVTQFYGLEMTRRIKRAFGL